MDNNEKLNTLLSIWRACLVDHHKDKDCWFNITQQFSAYPSIYDRQWIITHAGYLYDWTALANTYEEAIHVLCDELIYMIRDVYKTTQECVEGYTEEQHATMQTNIKRLESLLNG